MDYLKQANEAVNKVAKSEGIYKELEKEIKYYIYKAKFRLIFFSFQAQMLY